ncbi:hypothetical protein [Rhizobium sp. C4]|uniref:hypothetical protein n=1 Tax=Rhizobium sp. C4 TaxID=1349800 RepID=UPI001E46705B|nr:hypothetical protein [Rhizobium sp. C4]MCD2173778.1 hypothetical protein [Rhizobium sp. C4]
MRDKDGTGLGGMIRLHDIAAAYGDGLIPELYDLLTRPAPPVEIAGNVVALPLRHAEPLNPSLKNRENLRDKDEAAGSTN